MMTAALAAGCGAKADTTTAAPTQAETTQAETTKAEQPKAETTQSEDNFSLNRRNRGKNGICDRKIEEIKDFMFTIESDKGIYAMTFDTAPEGYQMLKKEMR